MKFSTVVSGVSLIAASAKASNPIYQIPEELLNDIQETYEAAQKAASGGGAAIAAADTADSAKSSSSSASASDACQYPAQFTIDKVNTWVPGADEKNSTFLPWINFSFSDNDTSIATTCNYDDTTAPVNNTGPGSSSGLAARYSCENTAVQFIWQTGGKLTMIEKACTSQASKAFESSGSLVISQDVLLLVSQNSTGSQRQSDEPMIRNFTSIQPSPLSSSTSGSSSSRRARRVRRTVRNGDMSRNLY